MSMFILDSLKYPDCSCKEPYYRKGYTPIWPFSVRICMNCNDTVMMFGSIRKLFWDLFVYFHWDGLVKVDIKGPAWTTGGKIVCLPEDMK